MIHTLLEGKLTIEITGRSRVGYHTRTEAVIHVLQTGAEFKCRWMAHRGRTGGLEIDSDPHAPSVVYAELHRFADACESLVWDSDLVHASANAAEELAALQTTVIP